MPAVVDRRTVQEVVNEVGLFLWRLLPANPIVLRVVQGGSRRTQHLWIRGGYLLALLGLLIIAQLSLPDSGGSLSDLAKRSTLVFGWIATLQLLLMCLLAPVFTAGAISQEKDAETFNILLTTPLTNAQIVLGSLMSRLFFVLTLLVAGLPIISITMIFGGVTSRQIFLSFAIAACTALLTGSLAILVSVLRVGTRGTIFSFYVGIAFYLTVGFALGLSPWTYIPESIVPGVSSGMTFLALVHPYWALEVALDRIQAPETIAVAHRAWPLNHALAAPYTAYMVLTVVVSVILIAVATAYLRSGIKQGEQGWWTRLFEWLYRARSVGERRQRARRVWSNPVAWREAVTRANAASGNLMKYVYITSGIVIALIYVWFEHANGFVNVVNARNWLIGIVLVEFIVVLLMVANTAATAITRERDDGTMDLLLTTPLTSNYIVWGKLRGLISFAAPLMVMPAATVILVWLFDLIFVTRNGPVVNLASAAILPLLLAIYAAFTSMVGLHLSLKSRKSIQSVILCIGILAGTALGLGLCALAAVNSAPQVGALLAPLTFVTAVYYALDPGQILDARRGSIVATLGEIQILFGVGTVIALGLYGAIVAGTHRTMVTNFDMIVRKQQQ